ncbi:MAG: hypothetical protein ACRDTD_18450 [Pseudonocardiaceae bacterium]
MLDLVAAGRRFAQIAIDLDISEQTSYVWRRQELIDTGQLPHQPLPGRGHVAVEQPGIRGGDEPRRCARGWSRRGS